jgi:hypothetical protein
MKKLLLPLAIAASCAQADYQAELGYAYSDSETDVGAAANDEVNSQAIVGTVYFESVDTNKGPYAEAAFHSKASSLSVGYSHVQMKPAAGGDTTDDSVAYGAHIVLDGGWILDVAAGDGEVLGESSDFYTVGGGLYLDDHSTLTLHYTDAELDDVTDGDLSIISLGYKRTTAHDDGSYCNLEVGLSHVEDDLNDDDYASLAGVFDYYIDKHFSVGLTLGYADAEEEAISYGVRSQFFFNDKVGISFAYEEVDVDNADDNEEVWTAGVNLRF